LRFLTGGEALRLKKGSDFSTFSRIFSSLDPSAAGQGENRKRDGEEEEEHFIEVEEE